MEWIKLFFIWISSLLKRGIALVCLSAALAVAVPAAAANHMTQTNTTTQPGAMSSCPNGTVEAYVVKLTNNDTVTRYINSMGFDVNGVSYVSNASVSIYHDINGNGVVDGSDIFLQSGLYYDTGGVGEVAIAPGASTCFIVTLTFSSTVSVGSTYQVTLDPTQLWVDTDTYGGDAAPPTLTNSSVSPLITVNASCGGASTATATFTNTSTLTQTATSTATATATCTSTQTNTSTIQVNTATDTSTLASTGTSTSTSTLPATNTATSTNTCTSTQTNTDTPPLSSTATSTGTSTDPPTLTNTPRSTETSTMTSTATSTTTASHTLPPTSTPTVTCTFTATPLTQVLCGPPYPNPSLGGSIRVDVTTPSAGSIEMEVLTVAMRKVADHRFAVHGGGPMGITTPVEWDLRDQSGMTVSNGIYYVKIKVTGSVSSTKVLKVLVLR